MHKDSLCVLLESANHFCEKCNGWGVMLLNNNNKRIKRSETSLLIITAMLLTLLLELTCYSETSILKRVKAKLKLAFSIHVYGKIVCKDNKNLGILSLVNPIVNPGA